jgi:magnesium-protoporphyrin O-methyltransferase
MADNGYLQRRSQIETYFDRTASDAWSRLTSDAPVSRIRQTVREGRDSMRQVLLDWLPEDLSGKRFWMPAVAPVPLPWKRPSAAPG